MGLMNPGRSGLGHVSSVLRMHVKSRARFIDDRGDELPDTMVLSPVGLLPVIAQQAKWLSEQMLNEPMDVRLAPDPAALTGYRCQVGQLSGSNLWMLFVAAEQIMGLDDPEIGPGEVKDVDVQAIIEFLMIPDEERSADRCPWRQVEMLALPS